MSEEKNSSFIGETLKFALITLAIVLPIRFFIAEPFVVSGGSMEPTFETGDYLIIDRLSYRFSEPMRGEVVIFRYPNEPSKYFIKRVVGLPGETVEMHGRMVTIKNKDHPKGLNIDQSYILFADGRTDELSITLKSDEYFVLGDNRPASSDSRVWGPLERQFFIGRAYLRLLPLEEASILPGDRRQQE